MKAVQYRKVGAKPEVVSVPDPEPGPGQALLAVVWSPGQATRPCAT